MARSRRIRRRTANSQGIWKKVFLWSIGGIVVLIIGGVFGAISYVKSYLKSQEFSDSMRQMAIDDLNVDDATLAPIVWDGSGIACDNVSMAGSEFLSGLKMDKMEAEFDRWGLLSREFVMNSFNIQSLNVKLAPVPFRGRDVAREETWMMKNVMPKSFHVEQGRIHSLTVSYGDDSPYILENSSAEARYHIGSNQYEINLKGGKVKLPFSLVSDLDLVGASIQFNHASQRVNITNCRILPKNKGDLDVLGEWDGNSKNWTSSVVVNNVPLDSLLKEDWKQRIQGNLNGSVNLSGHNTELGHVNGLIRVSNGLVTGLPVLDRLAQFCDTSDFRRMPLQKATARFERRNDGAWHFSDIVLESENLMRVIGWVEVSKENELSGRLSIGLRMHGPWATLFGFNDVFSASNDGQDGLMWANVNLAGTLDKPEEDLSARLLKAAGSRVLNAGSQLLGGSVSGINDVSDVASRLFGKMSRQDPDEKNEKDASKKEEKNSAPSPLDDAVETIKDGSNLMRNLLNL